MKKYEIIKRIVEIPYKDRHIIKEGCTSEDPSPDYIEIFDSLDDAKRALKKYKTSVSEFTHHGRIYYSVTEYGIEENEYDDDGELTVIGDIWDFSPMQIKVIEKPSYDELAVCSSYSEAEDVVDSYDGDNEACILL